MDIESKLTELELTPDNAIVICSGVLNALGIRESKDIDLVVTEEKYQELTDNGRFHKVDKHGHELLVDDLFEIGTSWTVLDKSWEFEELINYSTVIDGGRYNTVEFLLEVKRRRLTDGDAAPKTIDDVRLINQYLSTRKK